MKTTSKETKDCFTSFEYRDSDFDNWLPEVQPAREGTVTVHQLPNDMTFKGMATHFFGSDDVEVIKKHTLTLPMVEEMIKTRESELETSGWGNFFFVENEDGCVSVACVTRDDDDRPWRASVYELAFSYRWCADGRLMVANYDSMELKNLDTLSLEARVQALENWRDSFRKILTNAVDTMP